MKVLTAGLAYLRERYISLSRPVTVVFIITAAIFTATLFIMDINRIMIFGFMVGIAAVYLLSYITVRDSHIKADYIQNGEAFWSALFIFIAARLISVNLPVIIIITWIGMFLMELLLRMIYDPKKNQTLYFGLMFNGVATLAAYYLYRTLPSRSVDILTAIATGYAGTNTHVLYPVVTGIIIAVIALLAVKLHPEISLLSQGSREYSISGLGYSASVLTLLAARSLVVTIVIAFTGFLGGISYYLLYMTGSHLPAMAMTVSYMTLLLIVYHFFGPVPAAGVSIFLTYLFYMIYSRYRGGIYDRD